MKWLYTLLVTSCIISCSNEPDVTKSVSFQVDETYLIDLKSIICSRYPLDTICVFNAINHKSNSILFKFKSDTIITEIFIFNTHSDLTKIITTKDSIDQFPKINFSLMANKLVMNYGEKDLESFSPDIILLRFIAGELREKYTFNGAKLNWKSYELDEIQALIFQLNRQI